MALAARQARVAASSGKCSMVAAPSRVRSVVVRASEGAAPAAPAAAEKKAWTQPTLNPDTPSPIFGGSTGGLLRKAQVCLQSIRGQGAEEDRRSRRSKKERASAKTRKQQQQQQLTRVCCISIRDPGAGGLLAPP